MTAHSVSLGRMGSGGRTRQQRWLRQSKSLLEWGKTLTRRLLTIALLGCAIAKNSVADWEPTTLLRRVAENQKKSRLLEMSYVYEVTRTQLTLGRNSEVKKNESRTFEVTPLEDGDYRKLIKKNGLSLSEDEARKEQHKLEESLRKRAGNSAERSRLEKKRAERRRKESQLWDEVLKAFEFRPAVDETHHGRRVLAFDAIPRPQYVPADHDLKILKKIQGRLWVDEAEAQIVRADIEFIEDLKFGAGFLAKINKGGMLKVWQRKVNDEAWFPDHSEVVVNGRIAVFKSFNLKLLSEFSNYRKFETKVNLLPAEGPIVSDSQK